MFYDFYINFCLFVVDVALSSDFMTGFCGETEEEHNDTISLLNLVEFDMAYMFAYSMRKVIYTISWNWFHDCIYDCSNNLQCSSYFSYLESTACWKWEGSHYVHIVTKKQIGLLQFNFLFLIQIMRVGGDINKHR